MSWQVISLEVSAAITLLFILVALIVVQVKSREISESRRFPVLFFGLSMLGYLLLTIEIILYTIHHSLLDISYLWIFYVVGAPLSFLPVMMLAWRIKIIYTGYFDIYYWKSVPLTQVHIKLGQRWLLIRLAIFMLPCLAFYPLIIFFGPYGDLAFVIWLLLYLAVFLYIVVQLRGSRIHLKQHHQDQTVILLIFWAMQFVNVVYTNLAWYVFSYWEHRYTLDTITLIVLDIDVMVTCGLWYANYRIVRARDKGVVAKGKEKESNIEMLGGKDDHDDRWRREYSLMTRPIVTS